jgi:nitronate monooxygenase
MDVIPAWSRLPGGIAQRLRLPVIAAPMLRVSGPGLVVAACRAGVMGAFPTKNARSAAELDDWLRRIEIELEEGAESVAPYCPNLIIRDQRRDEDLACLVKHKVEIVITSVGSPAPVLAPLHDVGCLVFADIATLDHARKAIALGVDGLVLLTAGAGGQTGWLNPFAFVRAVREIFAGPIVLAGGMSDGRAVRAAQVLGCDLAYMGTKFIATAESLADDRYRQMLASSTIDDVVLTRNFNGLRANYLRPSIVAAGIDPDRLDEAIDEERARRRFGGEAPTGPRRWVDLLSAGHSVSGVTGVPTVRGLIEQTIREYAQARGHLADVVSSLR